MADELRPLEWKDYIGQRKLKRRLKIEIQAANDDLRPMHPLLLVGPPGCGKTSLSQLIAQELYQDFISFVMPIKPQVLRRLIQNFEGVVLLDEIHQMPKGMQNDLLPVFEDGYLQLDTGGRIECEDITFIAATTEPEKVIAPLHERCITPPFDPYTDRQMGRIVQNMARKVGVDIDRETAVKVGKATGGVPRQAKEIVRMMRNKGTTDPDTIFESLRITADGLTEYHLRYLAALNDCGGTAGLEIISAHLRLPKAVLVDLERLLVQRKAVEYSKQGRQLTGKGYKILSGDSNNNKIFF